MCLRYMAVRVLILILLILSLPVDIVWSQGQISSTSSSQNVDTTNSAEVMRPITVSSHYYTSQLILGQMVKLLLEDAGYPVIDKLGLGGAAVVRQALLKGEVDVTMDLTGSALAVGKRLPVYALPQQPDRIYTLIKNLDSQVGLVWLDRGEFNESYTLMVRDDLVALGITTMDDLAAYMNENGSPLSICVENHFFIRPHDGLRSLQAHYGFEFSAEKIFLMDLDGVYDGLRNGVCDVAEGYTTDGRLLLWGFTALEDSSAFFPAYNIAPVIRQEVLDANPDLANLLNALPKYLDDATMQQLSTRVDLGPDGILDSGDEEAPELVALTFLDNLGLLTSPESVGDSRVAAGTE